jgi:hypothetical protein
MENLTERIFEESFKLSVSVGDILKIPLIVLLIGNIFYAFMLVLKVKILVDTVEAEGNSKIKKLVYLNLLISILIGIVGTVIIILA